MVRPQQAMPAALLEGGAISEVENGIPHCCRCGTLLLYQAPELWGSGFRITALNCGGAMRIRTPDLLHAMRNTQVHLPLDAGQRRAVMLNTARATFRTTVRSRSKDLGNATDHMITSCSAR